MEQRRLKELEIEEKIRQEKIENRKLLFLIIISFVLGFVGICFFIFGSISDPGLNVIGAFIFIVICYIWLYRITNEKNRKGKKK